ncbi:MAG: polysaccharide biosynthesis protein [Oscillospiraceae bacterium]|nr:polysaccharide biosynthesis protein [Oscillospiraceae bacterium]
MGEAKRQNYLHGAAILTAGVAIMKILGALYKIPLRNLLGDTGYGYFYAAYTIYNVMLTISTAGLPVALSRLISEANTLGKPRQARRTFLVALGALFTIGALFSLAMFLFPTEIAALFVSKAAVSQCVFAISPSVLLICLTSAFRGYIQGNGNMAPTMVGQVLEVLVKVAVGLALAYCLIQRGASLPVAAAGAIFGVTAGSVAALCYMLFCYLRQYRRRDAENCRLSDDVPDTVGHTLRRFIHIGVVITLGASVMSVISLIDTKLIQLQLPRVAGISPALSDELYGSYSAMTTLFNLPASFITPMTISLVPAISTATARRDKREVGELTESGLRISSVIAMPMGIGLSVLSHPIVNILYTDTHPIGPAILTILGAASIFVCLSLVTNAILQADGDEKLPIFSMLAGGCVKIAANLLLVRIPEINILGAAIGSVCCYMTICIMNCVFIYRRMAVKPRYLHTFLRPLFSALVMGASAWAVYGICARLFHVAEGASRLSMLAALCIAIAIAVVVYVVMAILTRSVTMEDIRLIPKAEKIARRLHIR